MMLVGLVSALGAPIGAYVGSLARSEFKLGENNIRVLGHILLAMVTYFVLGMFPLAVFVPALVAIVVGAILSYYDFHVVTHKAPAIAIMVLLGAAVAFSVKSVDFPVIASIVFVYGISAGSLCYIASDWKRAMLYGGVLLLAFIVSAFFV